MLRIVNLIWGKGLPAGMHEIEIINRMRMRRAWESILPIGNTPKNIKIRARLLYALEMDELAFMEAVGSSLLRITFFFVQTNH